MPIADDYEPKQVTGDGVTTVVTFNFKIYTAADLLIVKTDNITLDSVDLVLNTDYTVVVNATTGGTVTFLAPLVADKIYTLASNIAQSQTLSVQQVGKFRNDQYISALDRLTRIVQDVADAVKRSIKAPVNNPSFNGTLSGSVVAGRALVIDDAGTGIKISETDVGALDSAISTTKGCRDAAAASAGASQSAQGLAEAAQEGAETAQGLAEDARDAAQLAAAQFTKATQAQAEAGTDDATYMTPLKTKQAIAAQVSVPAFGAWTALTIGNTYQAATDGFVVAKADGNADGATVILDIYTDDSATPLTIRASDSLYRNDAGVTIVRCSCMSPVRAGDYYKVTAASESGSVVKTAYFIGLV